MFTARTLVLISVPVLVWESRAQAQGQQVRESLLSQRGYLGLGVVPSGQNRKLLLTHPSVQKDMTISPSQQKALQQIDEEHGRVQDRLAKEHSDSMAELRAQEANPEQLTALTEKYYAQARQVHAEVDAAMMKVLDRRQRIRLDQIQLQIEGPWAFRRPEIQERLNMDPGQIEAITTMAAEGREEVIRVSALPTDMLRSLFGGAPRERTALQESDKYQSEVDKSREAALKARAATMQRIAKVFTKKQRETYQKMLGEPFDVLTLRLPSQSTAPESKEKTKTAESKQESKAR